MLQTFPGAHLNLNFSAPHGADNIEDQRSSLWQPVSQSRGEKKWRAGGCGSLRPSPCVELRGFPKQRDALLSQGEIYCTKRGTGKHFRSSTPRLVSTPVQNICAKNTSGWSLPTTQGHRCNAL